MEIPPTLVQTIVDMSCGSGLFARRFARSGKFEAVVAADFSESMLAQAKLFFEEDKSIDPRYILPLLAHIALCSVLAPPR